ncbi:MAG: DUF3010 family protein [Aliishimia sp.]
MYFSPDAAFGAALCPAAHACVCETRAKKGKMARGAVSFKIETLIQLVEDCDTRFVSPVALSNFAKKQLEAYPQKLLVYLKKPKHPAGCRRSHNLCSAVFRQRNRCAVRYGTQHCSEPR